LTFDFKRSGDAQLCQRPLAIVVNARWNRSRCNRFSRDDWDPEPGDDTHTEQANLKACLATSSDDEPTKARPAAEAAAGRSRMTGIMASE